MLIPKESQQNHCDKTIIVIHLSVKVVAEQYRCVEKNLQVLGKSTACKIAALYTCTQVAYSALLRSFLQTGFIGSNGKRKFGQDIIETS